MLEEVKAICPTCKQEICRYRCKQREAINQLDKNGITIPVITIPVIEISCWSCGHVFSVIPKG